MRTLRAAVWSPWAVGVALGVLSWFAFATANRGLGITTPFEITRTSPWLWIAGLAVAVAAAHLFSRLRRPRERHSLSH